MKKSPNIIFVLTDDQGYGDLGCTGNPIIVTPNIDTFYDESVRFTNYHVGPTCAPTRAGLMTGHYANSTGVWHTIGGRSLLRRQEWTLADALKENGYATGIFGKWHLGDTYPYRPMDRGFEKSIIHGGGGISQTPDYWGNDYFDDTYFVNGAPKKFKGYCTDVFFNEAIDFIEERKNKPFFCYIATNAPHDPYNVDAKYSSMYESFVPEDRARFYGMITNIDENFGKLRDKLDELDILDNTILIFMTDNGSSAGADLDQDGFVVSGYNAGMRGIKNSEYDGGHRVPFFIRWSEEKLNHASDVDELTANIDFMPTLLDLCNIPIKENVRFHGKSLKSLLFKDSKWEDRTIVTDSQRVAYPVKWRKSAVMTNKWRLINGRELYNIEVDREQRCDEANNYPQKVKNLRLEYEKWWDIVSEQFDKAIPMLVGDRPIQLTTHDLRNEECNVAWNQKQIRKGMQVNGYWEVEVEYDGQYEFHLRRWPKSQNRPIVQGINGEDIQFKKESIQQKHWECYTQGIALNLESASISIQGITKSINIEDDATVAVLTARLKKGSTSLKAWFNDKFGNNYTAAYYVDIAKYNNK